MSVNLTIAGQTFAFPTVGENNWGQVVTNWATAVSTQLLQRTGGTFSLTNDVNFGANFGTIQAYLKSRTTNIANAGFIRMAVADAIAWRNNANNANLLLAVDSSNRITFDGVILATVSAALTASRVLVSDADGKITVSSATAAEVAFLVGVTSSIQSQLDSKQATGSYLTALTGEGTAAGPGSAALTLSNAAVIAKVLTGYTSGAGTVSASDSILSAIQKLNGNTELKAPLSPTVSTKTTTFSFLTTDKFVYVSGAGGAYTGTLPAASGNSGLSYSVKKTTNDFNAITLTDGTFSTTLNTIGEQVVLVCDGTNWDVITRKTDTAWLSYAGSWSATSVNPAIGNGTIGYNWRRRGNTMEVSIQLLAGSTTTFGTGDWVWSLPTGPTIDTTSLQVASVQNTGLGYGSNTQASYHACFPIYRNTTSFFAAADNNGGRLGPTVPEAWANGQTLSLTAILPISGWNA